MDERPNILVFMVDDLDVGSLRAMTDAGFMPNLKRHIIDKGMSFTESFVTNSICCPSRATFLTGQYSHNHGVRGNVVGVDIGGSVITGIVWWDLVGDGERDLDFQGENSTIAVWLDQAGYYTGYVGKYLSGHGVDSPKTHVPPGWDDWQALLDPVSCVYDYEIYDSQEGSVFNYGEDGSITKIVDGEVVEVTFADDWTDNYQTDVLAGRSVQFISESAQMAAPFFVAVMPFAPHLEACTRPDVGDFDHPIQAQWRSTIRPAERHVNTDILPSLDISRPSFNEVQLTDKPRWMWDEEANPKYLPPLNELDIEAVRTQYKTRLASLRAIDDLVGIVIAELADTGQLDDTVIIFTSDNGWLYGEHRLTGKTFAYEESIRVPLYVVTLGRMGPETRTQMVLNNDLAPTIMELAGSSPPPEFLMDGRSLVPLLSDSEPAWERKRLLVEHSQIVDTLAGIPTIPTFYALRTQKSLYVHWQDAFASREFYPYIDQPLGMFQLHSAYAGLSEDNRTVLKEGLLSLISCQGSDCRATED